MVETIGAPVGIPWRRSGNRRVDDSTAAGADRVQGSPGTKAGEWPTYGGDLGHTRYSPLDQINATNFSKLEVAWRFKTDNLGPRSGIQPRVDAADGQRQAVFDRRHAARRRRRSTPRPASCCGCTASTKARAVRRRRGSCRAAASRTGATDRKTSGSST